MERITLASKQVAEMLGKSISWVYENASSLGAVKIGGSWIFTEESLKAALQAKTQRHEPPKVPLSKKSAKHKKRLKPDYETNPAKHGIASFVNLVSSKNDDEEG